MYKVLKYECTLAPLKRLLLTQIPGDTTAVSDSVDLASK